MGSIHKISGTGVYDTEYKDGLQNVKDIVFKGESLSFYMEDETCITFEGVLRDGVNLIIVGYNYQDKNNKVKFNNVVLTPPDKMELRTKLCSDLLLYLSGEFESLQVNSCRVCSVCQI